MADQLVSPGAQIVIPVTRIRDGAIVEEQKIVTTIPWLDDQGRCMVEVDALREGAHKAVAEKRRLAEEWALFKAPPTVVARPEKA